MRKPTRRFWQGLWLGSVVVVPVLSAVLLLALPAPWRGTVLAGLGIIFGLMLWAMIALSRRKQERQHEGQTYEERHRC